MYFLNFVQGSFAALDKIVPEATPMVKGSEMNFGLCAMAEPRHGLLKDAAAAAMAHTFKNNRRFGSKLISQDLVVEECERP